MRRKSLALFTRTAFLPYPERNDRSWASVCENRRVSDVSILQREMYSEAEAARLLRVTQATLHYWLEGKKWRERLGISGAGEQDPRASPPPVGAGRRRDRAMRPSHTVYDNRGIKGPRIVAQMTLGFVVGSAA
jgi:hypothetical protein